VRQHRGGECGDRIELDFLPDDQYLFRAALPKEAVAGFVGCLTGRTKKTCNA
jgi:hypothetical protein